MFIKYNDDSIRYTGRWDIGDKDAATTTAPGSIIELAFRGTMAVLHFDMEMNMHPYPHVWVSVDDGAKVETVVNHIIRVEAPETGDHVVKMIYKSAVEIQPRWYQPLIGKIRFKGADVEERAALSEDNRKVIEFIGDSITEGVQTDTGYCFEQYGPFNGQYQADSTATYAWLTARELNMKPVIIGYGAVGVTHSGSGNVPKAGESYPYNFDGSPAISNHPEIIVINHGANDIHVPTEKYAYEYKKLLEVVRKINPESKIVVLPSFGGVHVEALKKMVEAYNLEQDDQVYFVDSAGWKTGGFVHPSRQEHAVIAKHLSQALRKILIEPFSLIL